MRRKQAKKVNVRPIRVGDSVLWDFTGNIRHHHEGMCEAGAVISIEKGKAIMFTASLMSHPVLREAPLHELVRDPKRNYAVPNPEALMVALDNARGEPFMRGKRFMCLMVDVRPNG
jgi:hypothetical protein